MREIILAYFILRSYFHLKFALNGRTFVFLVTIYLTLILSRPVKIRPWKSEVAPMSSSYLQPSATTRQTGSGL